MYCCKMSVYELIYTVHGLAGVLQPVGRDICFDEKKFTHSF